MVGLRIGKRKANNSHLIVYFSFTHRLLRSVPFRLIVHIMFAQLPSRSTLPSVDVIHINKNYRSLMLKWKWNEKKMITCRIYWNWILLQFLLFTHHSLHIDFKLVSFSINSLSDLRCALLRDEILYHTSNESRAIPPFEVNFLWLVDWSDIKSPPPNWLLYEIDFKSNWSF